MCECVGGWVVKRSVNVCLGGRNGVSKCVSALGDNNEVNKYVSA